MILRTRCSTTQGLGWDRRAFRACFCHRTTTVFPTKLRWGVSRRLLRGVLKVVLKWILRAILATCKTRTYFSADYASSLPWTYVEPRGRWPSTVEVLQEKGKHLRRIRFDIFWKVGLFKETVTNETFVIVRASKCSNTLQEKRPKNEIFFLLSSFPTFPHQPFPFPNDAPNPIRCPPSRNQSQAKQTFRSNYSTHPPTSKNSESVRISKKKSDVMRIARGGKSVDVNGAIAPQKLTNWWGVK